jgi:molybdenum cofactor cytidylyltransferase
LIDRLIVAFDPLDDRAIRLPTWWGRCGNPVLFARRFFAEIQAISGDMGARGLIGDYPDLVCEVPMPDDTVLTDVDTPEALAALKPAG